MFTGIVQAMCCVEAVKDQPAGKRTAKAAPAAKSTKPLRNWRVHLGKSQTKGQRNSQRRTTTAQTNADNLPYEPGELLVADAPSGFKAAARSLGLTTVRSTSLKGLGLTLQRLIQNRTGVGAIHIHP